MHECGGQAIANRWAVESEHGAGNRRPKLGGGATTQSEEPGRADVSCGPITYPLGFTSIDSCHRWRGRLANVTLTRRGNCKTGFGGGPITGTGWRTRDHDWLHSAGHCLSSELHCSCTSLDLNRLRSRPRPDLVLERHVRSGRIRVHFSYSQHHVGSGNTEAGVPG